MDRALNLARLQHLCRSSLTASRSVLGPLVAQTGRVLLGSWVNILLFCVPAGLALNYTSGPALAIFIVNFFAAVGLLALGDTALECITSRVGSLYGSLLYISTSNLMQMISSIVLLVQNQVDLLQVSLVGSLLANILLLPALSIFYAAFRRKFMAHNYHINRNYTLMLSLAVSGFIIPTVFDREPIFSPASTAAVSRATSIILMLAYGAHLYFQLSVHRNRFGHFMRERHEKADELLISIRVALGIFVVTSVLLYFCVDLVVNSIQELEEDSSGFGFFTGFILIPILNCDVAAVEQAGRSMDLMLMFTIGKCIQSALLIAPFLVVISWGMGIDTLNLSFDLWMVVSLFISVYILNTLLIRESFNC
ncbi:hypothetical protein VMCG_02944 [Cytospora schulzeri]|uniref:Sodium/calcium exchanger membrane region domain-containing protein n=1 Tax=Cytospora schulzeri TaxID=448051 RepID=A0A423WZI4_9PEZI|nr:hypothetical protein VMCG_02944 [Valsa malicola]